jgi:hypothetical protein
MTNQSEEVNQFMEKLEHPLKEAIEQARAIILDSDPQISEHIKWNAPSFLYNGEDRLTFNLHQRDRIQLIFHRGAKVKDSQGFVFEDSTGLLEWVTADRAKLTLLDMQDLDAKKMALRKVVNQWIKV